MKNTYCNFTQKKTQIEYLFDFFLIITVQPFAHQIKTGLFSLNQSIPKNYFLKNIRLKYVEIV